MFLHIWKFARPYWKNLAVIAVIVVVMASLSQVEPFVTKQVTDVLVNKTENAFFILGTLLGILLTVKLIQSVLNRLSWYLTSIFAVNFESELKQIGFDHLMKLSLSFFNDQETGKVMSKLDRGVNRMIMVVNNSGLHFIPSVTTALIAFSIVVFYEWRIGVLTVLAFIPYIWINHWRFIKNEKLERKEYKLYDEQYAHFWEVISSMSLIKAFRAEVFEKKKFADFFTKYKALRREIERNTNKAYLGDILLELLVWSMYAYMVWLTWQGHITLGTLILLVGLTQLIRQPLWQINWIFWEVKRAQTGARDFFKIMGVVPTITDPVKPVSLPTVTGHIEFKNLTFTYKAETKNLFEKEGKDDETESDEATKKAKKPAEEMQPQTVFDNLSFTITPHQTTALVGPSGSGKTTIASLLLRFFDPDSGEILLDGINIKDLKQRELRKHVGLVGQDAIMFAATIEENLRYAKPSATQEEMWQACELAYAAEFIRQFPKGLQSQIGERGVKLSGGQRQRLSLARTILRNPDIIVLDEATSALDSESELYIQRALQTLLQNKTAVIIAHRLSTIQRADNIIVLKEKQVLEQGTHQELLRQDGLYASLFKIQSGQIDKLKEWDLVA